jgi:hypothetical protein
MQPSEDDATELAKNSTLYKEFLAEREEICGIDPLLNSKFTLCYGYLSAEHISKTFVELLKD